jgi:hypothetical protein
MSIVDSISGALRTSIVDSKALRALDSIITGIDFISLTLRILIIDS